MDNIDVFRLNYLNVALEIASIINKETDDSSDIDKILQITKRILDIQL